jgi:hypothetical protein
VYLAIGINANTPSARNSVMVDVLKQVGIHIREWPVAPRRSYDFDLEDLVGSYRGINGTRLETWLEGSSMVFAFRGRELSSSGVRIPIEYDKLSNTLTSTGSGPHRRVHLAAFLSPDDFQPCVTCELTAFRKTNPG